MGQKEFIDINRIQKILRGVAGIKSILWILAILRGVYGVMGPLHDLISQSILHEKHHTLMTRTLLSHLLVILL